MHQTHAALGASAQWWRHMIVTVEHLERTGVDIYLPRVSPFRFGLVMSRLNSLWWLRMTIPICFLQLVQNSWNLCGKIIPLFFPGLEGFCHLPSGFCPGLWQEPKGVNWKRWCWHRPGPFSWGSVEYDSSANSEMRHYFLTLEVSYFHEVSICPIIFHQKLLKSSSHWTYWTRCDVFCPRSWVCTWTCCKTTALDRVMCIT